jgi:hypothetical protein
MIVVLPGSAPSIDGLIAVARHLKEASGAWLDEVAPPIRAAVETAASRQVVTSDPDVAGKRAMSDGLGKLAGQASTRPRQNCPGRPSGPTA